MKLRVPMTMDLKILYQLGWIALEDTRPREAQARFAEILSAPALDDSLRVAADYGLGIAFVRADSLSAAVGPLERVRQSRGAAWGPDARYALAFIYLHLQPAALASRRGQGERWVSEAVGGPPRWRRR